MILIAPALNACKPKRVCSVRDLMRQLGFLCLLRGVKRYPGTLFTGWSCLAPHQGRWPRLGRVLSLLLEARLLSGRLKGLICSLAPVSRAVLEFGTAAFKSGTGLTLASCALFVCFGADSDAAFAGLWSMQASSCCLLLGCWGPSCLHTEAKSLFALVSSAHLLFSLIQTVIILHIPSLWNRDLD